MNNAIQMTRKIMCFSCEKSSFSARNRMRCEFCRRFLLLNKKYLLSHQMDRSHFFNDPKEEKHTAVFEVFLRNKTTQEYILKIIKSSDPHYSERLEFLQKEAFALSKLNHPAIPKLVEYPFNFQRNGLEIAGIIIEKIEGSNLQSHLLFKALGETGKPFCQNLVLEWIKQMIDILDYIHEEKFIHRDIKPENIILKRDGQLALIDFGAAHKIEENGEEENGESEYIKPVGTLRYAPIEQWLGYPVFQSDFHALGRTMIEMVTGKSCFSLAKDNKDSFWGNLQIELDWRDKAPQIDNFLADLLDLLSERNYKKRPPDTKTISQILKNRSIPPSFLNTQIDLSCFFN